MLLVLGVASMERHAYKRTDRYGRMAPSRLPNSTRGTNTGSVNQAGINSISQANIYLLQFPPSCFQTHKLSPLPSKKISL